MSIVDSEREQQTEAVKEQNIETTTLVDNRASHTEDIFCLYTDTQKE